MMMAKAKPGDTILITNKVYGEDRYENGDVFEVTDRQHALCGSFVEVEGECSRVLVYNEEYEVVPNYAPGGFVKVKDSGSIFEVGRKEGLRTVITTQGHVLDVADIEPYLHGPYTTEKIHGHSITADKIAIGAGVHLVAGSIDSAHIGTGTITTLRHDLVNQPSHYTQGKYEVIDMIAELVRGYEKLPYVAYCLGNVIKYIARAPFKHESPLEDLRKARRYLDYAINHVEESEGKK